MADVMGGARGDAVALLAELRARPHGNKLSQVSWRRDPRSAPTPIRRNATAEESCGFYGLADALTGVRYARSCHDCLKTPGCALTLSGYCLNESSLGSVDRDALQTVKDRGYALSPGLPVRLATGSSAFYPGRATYCASTDQGCAKCHDLFTDQARTRMTREELDSQFCVGDDGCVCTGVCEVPELRASRAVDYTNGEKAKVYRDPHGPSLPSFSSRRRDPRSPLLPLVLDRKQVPEVCKYEPQYDVRGCKRPRTADECVKKEGCMAWLGECWAQENYQFNGDYRNGTLRFDSVYQVQFTSANTTICDYSQAGCQDCASDLETAWSNTATNGVRCYGANGCVCSQLWEIVEKSMSAKDND